MGLFTKKPVTVEAITFDQFVEYGKKNGGNIVNNMPWSFEYKGHSVTHENDELYLIPTKEGVMNFTPQDMLITGVKGEIYPCKIDIFIETYDTAERENENPLLDKDSTPKYKQNVRILVQELSENAELFAERIEKYCNKLHEDNPKSAFTRLEFTSSSNGRQTANITFLTVK